MVIVLIKKRNSFDTKHKKLHITKIVRIEKVTILYCPITTFPIKLNSRFTRSQLVLCPENQKKKLPFVRLLLVMESRDYINVYTPCICKTRCQINRCDCTKSNVLCNSMSTRNCEDK
ncbi:Uncharacterized protein FWK35_00018229 [Aphis craccivora]|uniref:KRAB-A domain-containing protein 2-like n=1 Tax=Aphis craccivora TaxID=307492 RepID=A0A6G0YXL7_APHCR|nr:Uncharacterized protein FWK35_00018229 [Aphis craccivora]